MTARSETITFKPRQPKRPYRVAKIGGGIRTFASIVSATRFAARQAQASWTDRSWLVTNTKTGAVYAVYRDGDVTQTVEGTRWEV